MKTVCLGSGEKPIEGATNVDWRPLLGVNWVEDLNERTWLLPSEYFDCVVAEQILEHMKDRLHFLDECRRILKPGGRAIIQVPNWKHQVAVSSLEHRWFFSRQSFRDSYITDGKWKCEKVEFQVCIPTPFGWRYYWVRNEFVGTQLDRIRGLVSRLRFYLRVVK